MSVTTQARELRGHPDRASEQLGHKELVARAAALIPQLRERVVEAEQTRKMPPANVEALRKAGLFRVLQAACYGGHQQSLRTHIDTVDAADGGDGRIALQLLFLTITRDIHYRRSERTCPIAPESTFR